MIFELYGSLFAAFAIMLLVMPVFLPYLKKLKFGQTIYDLGPQAHLSKQGTPNMGGIAIAAATVIVSVVVCMVLCRNYGTENRLWPLLFVMLGSMAIGFTDDFIKDVKKNHEGLKPKQKLIGQLVLGIAVSIYCYFFVGHDVVLPFTAGKTWDLGIFYIPLMTVLIMFMTNSANLQDGVDGILSTVTMVGMMAFGLIAVKMNDSVMGSGNNNGLMAAIVCFALCGGCLGFFCYNHHPAKIFMGDTGSMFIGGAMVGVAMITKCEFLLIPICFTSIMSSVSVMMQTTYFKITKKKYGQGRRIFKMAPLHHHFELSGMTENQIVLMYEIVTFILSAAAVLSVMGFFK